MRVIDWDDFIAQRPDAADTPLAITIGVFDGVHRGHRVLLERICAAGALATVITFRRNPLSILRPEDFPGDIASLAYKLRLFESLGLEQTVLIDFSGKFSTIHGGDFVDLLIQNRPVSLLALGPDFRCGYRLDTGTREISERARAAGIAAWIADPVMEGGRPVSSSRVRRAIAAGDFDEAERLLGRKASVDLDGVPAAVSFPQGGRCLSYNAAAAFRIRPPEGRYKALVYGRVADNGRMIDGESAEGIAAVVSVHNGSIIVPGSLGGDEFIPTRVEFLTGTQ
jgi:riboflavin kinase/FMN adenylyltransferase